MELIKNKKNRKNRFFCGSREAIVRTETYVSSYNGNLAFTPEGRKREETIQERIVEDEQEEQAFNQRIGRCR